MGVDATQPAREYLEFYRLDVSSDARAILVPSALLIGTGSLFVCVAAARIALPVAVPVPRDIVGFFGAALVLFGLVTGFGGMARLLSREGFVGVTVEGIHVRAGARDEFVTWGDVDGIRGERDRELELVLRDARAISLPPVSAPQGLSVRGRLEELRRKAHLNLLRR